MRLVAVGVFLILAFAGVAFAGVPSATTSTVERAGQGTLPCNPDQAVVCPKGDMGWVYVTVTVRNVYGDPLPGLTVNCQANVVAGPFCFCPGQTPQSSVSDINGQAFFTFIKFGGCGTLRFTADCQGVFFNPSPNIYVKSPDNNGDCAVGLLDFSAFALGYGGNNPCYDYDCNGIVNLLDFSTFSLHYGHVCPP